MIDTGYLRDLETVEERVDYLKDILKGEDIYIVTPGPSLLTHQREELLSRLKGKTVLACKQAYEYVKEVTTVHLLSCYSYQPYTYYSQDTLIHWQLTAMNMQYEVDKITNIWKHPVDIMLPCFSTPWVSMENTTASTRNFENWKRYSNYELIWGPGIMYESAFPLAIHLGCSTITTIGWDIGDLKKFTPIQGFKLGKDWHQEHATDLYKVTADGGPDYMELKNTIECTSEMYEWFTKNNIEVRILSDTNPADSRFKRIDLEHL